MLAEGNSSKELLSRLVSSDNKQWFQLAVSTHCLTTSVSTRRLTVVNDTVCHPKP